ncbi:MAG TPA: SHD1 domain-containing protein [Caulifigura sp.]|nr:SHD1 domain-containing protein [Caulifigura sp.]
MIRFQLQSISLSIVILTVGLAVTSVASAAPKPRKWKDASGAFEIEATFVSEANGVVTLKQTNGEEVEIELKQLSPADEAYVKTETAASKTPFKSKGSSSPFQSKTPTRPATGGEPVPGSPPNVAASTEPPPAIAVNWLNAPLLSTGGDSDWSSISITPAAAKKMRSTQLPAKRDFFESFTGIAVGDGFAILGYCLKDTFKKGILETTRLVRVNLESGKVEGTIIAEGAFNLLDVSATGDLILMRKEAPFGQEATDIEVWRPAGKVVERQKSFTPFAGDDKHHQEVQDALIGADGKIVAVARNGRAGVFDSETGESIGSTPKGHAIALSPDRKYAAILGEALLIVDLVKGETVAAVQTDKKSGGAIAFSPDGQRVAVAQGDDLTAWNLKDGSVYRDETFAALSASSTHPLVFTSPTHVFANGVLIDLENHIPLWQYEGVSQAAAAGSSTILLSDRGNQNLLVAATLPHQAAQLMLKQALATPGLFSVTPGTTMTVDVSALPDPAEQEKARAGLEASVVAAGMKVTPNSPIVVRASISTENKQQKFQTFGTLNSQDVNTTQHTTKVELLVSGQPVWQTSSYSGTGMILSAKQGESLQDAANRQSKPNYGLFAKVSIPQYVMQPGKKTLGQSTVNGPNF